ncbi:MAG: hypothetical protein MJE77_13275 [Proteobacteria bacterium]|nr:hypothetical protein [Pseudomonadota bacterium]
MGGGLGCNPLGDPSRSDIRGVVLLGTSPLIDAEMRVWQLGPNGERMERRPILTVKTDVGGGFHIDVGSDHYGALRFEVYGGRSGEYWSSDILSFDDVSRPARSPRWGPPGTEQPHLSAIFYRVHDRPDGYVIAISPWTTLAEARAWAHFSGFDGNVETTIGVVSERSLALLTQHLGLPDVIEVEPADLDAGGDALSPAVQYSLSLAALSTLAKQIAEQSGDTVQVVNTMTLTHALVDDISGREASSISAPVGHPISVRAIHPIRRALRCAGCIPRACAPILPRRS